MTRVHEISLDGIARKAAHLHQDADNLGTYVMNLDAKPRFRTTAQAALEEAEIALLAALHAVKTAKARYDEVPVQ